VREVFKASGAHGLAVFSPYYPAVLLAMLLGGRRCGVLAAVLGGFAAYYFFTPPLYVFVPLTLSDALNFALYGGACALIILIMDRYQRSVLQLRQEDARHLTLAREQEHRVKNAVAVIEAVVQQSLRDQPERGRTINRRIRAGLALVELESQDPDPPGGLRDHLAAELEPFDVARFTFEGE
jgi:K+-sensing histidine kinase KdpD